MMHVKNRELVVPGQVIAEGDYLLREGVFRDNEDIRASIVGLVDKRGRKIRVIPLEGRYIPTQGDRFVGIVTDEYHAGWLLDIRAPYPGNLSVSSLLQRKVDLGEEDISKYMDIGDVVVGRVQDVNELMNIRLEVTEHDRGKVSNGHLIEINPSRIPRVIGRKGSMISVLQNIGECNIEAGQNGRIIIWGEDPEKEDKVIEALFMIEREAHTSGLTERVRQFLEKE